MPLSFNQTLSKIYTAAKVAVIRNRLYAKKAARAGKPVLVNMLQSLESSESAHVRRFAMYLRGKTSGIDSFLRDYREGKAVELTRLYTELAAQYAAEGQAGKAENLHQFQKVLAAQAALIAAYQGQAENMPPDVYVCQICGFITTARPTANCPVCNAVIEKFTRFAP